MSAKGEISPYIGESVLEREFSPYNGESVFLREKGISPSKRESVLRMELERSEKKKAISLFQISGKEKSYLTICF